jgi:phage baseplate assembly protein W
MSTNIEFPLHPDGRGRTALSDTDNHVREMIWQVLFTSPGERVNRSDFGCGLLQMAFAPNSDLQAITARFLILGSLQRWLGDVITVDEVDVNANEERLEVKVVYRRRGEVSPTEAVMIVPVTGAGA